MFDFYSLSLLSDTNMCPCSCLLAIVKVSDIRYFYVVTLTTDLDLSTGVLRSYRHV